MKNRIKCLEMMGYTVIDNPRFNFIRVILETESKFIVHLTVMYDELLKDYSIEHIVRKINETICSNYNVYK